jgi:hypothetical protein
VRVEIDPSTSIPQLVVSLRFDAATAGVPLPAPEPAKAEPATSAEEPVEESVPATRAAAASPAPALSKAKSAAPAVTVQAAAPAEGDEEPDLGLPGKKLRAAGERAAKATTAAASAVVPALSRMSNGARDLFASLRGSLEKRREERAQAKKASAPRRVTAPPPSGALTSDGKRLVRQGQDADEEAPVSEAAPKRSRRGLVVGASVGLVVVAGVFGISKAMTGGSEPAAPVTAADVRAGQPPQGDVPPIPGQPAMGDVPLFGPTPLSTTEQVVPQPAPTAQAKAGAADGDDEEGGDDKAGGKDLVREWGNGEVSKPKVLKVRMDGPVSGFTATEVDGGFNLVVPGRKSLSTSTALVRKDKRISSLDVIPREDATEIGVRFKGEPPAYLVKVRSDRVEIALGADKSEKSDKSEGGDKKKVASKKKGDKKKKP